MESTKIDYNFKSSLINVVASCFVISGLLCIPKIFEKTFATGNFVSFDSAAMLKFSIALFFLSGLLFILKKWISINIGLIAFSIIFLLWIELIFRLFFVHLGSEKNVLQSAAQSNATYTEFQAYDGHPFAHFLGQPGVKLIGNKALKVNSVYNNFGFVGSDFYYYKPANVIRIACLGESTTADGYPKFLEDYLNANKQNYNYRFEVYNFGHAFWTTNHSVTNFALNVIDFSPDIVVVHHGWNEAKIRNFPAENFRGDYTHKFKVFNPPFVFDRYLIRVSAIYRYFKFKYDQNPRWTTLGGSIENEVETIDGNFDKKLELAPYTRNLNSLISLAQSNGIKVIFATLPYSTDSNIAMVEGKPNIIQCNNITREVCTKFQSQVSMVDLDQILTGKRNEIFVDLGHVTDEGRQLKAEIIGNAIIQICDSTFCAAVKYGDKGFSDKDGVYYYKNRMLSDSVWLNGDLKKKSIELRMPLDSVIEHDAQYLVEQEKLSK